MANLTPSASWDAVIQLEGTMAGVPATWNTPNQALLNRTHWLYTYGLFKEAASGNYGLGQSSPIAGLHIGKVPAVGESMLALQGQVVAAGDDRTHFNYRQVDGKYINFIRGTTTRIESVESFVASTRVSGTVFERLVIDQGGTIRPGADNTQTLGASSFRWSTIYAGTGTINTSDASLKTDIADLSAAELATAQAIKGLLKKFRFIDAVAAKGADARIHVGVIAQDVADAFEANGLDPDRYGLFCRDTWQDDEGNEVTRLGIRYEELLAFLIAAL